MSSLYSAPERSEFGARYQPDHGPTYHTETEWFCKCGYGGSYKPNRLVLAVEAHVEGLRTAANERNDKALKEYNAKYEAWKKQASFASLQFDNFCELQGINEDKRKRLLHDHYSDFRWYIEKSQRSYAWPQPDYPHLEVV